MLMGYARISTEDQSLDLQIDALVRNGVSPDRIFTDKGSGAKVKRKGLEECLRALEKGDVLVVWKLDRLARTLIQLIEIAENLIKREIGLKSITEAVDTTTPGGRLVFHVIGSIGQFERDLIRERTKAGLAAKRARGVKVGRKRIATPAKIERVKEMIRSGECTSLEAAGKKVGLALSTLYRDIPGGVAAILTEAEPEDIELPKT